MTLTWLHLESEPLHWLGLVRSIVEPRLAPGIQLDIQWRDATTRMDRDEESRFKIVSWTYTPVNGASPKDLAKNWEALWLLRQHYPDSLRLLLAPPTERRQQICFLEAGAHVLIPDATSFCRWLPKYLSAVSQKGN